MQPKTQSYVPTAPVRVVDAVICGDLLRVVLEGAPKLEATNAVEVLEELRARHEGFRQFVIGPPRGHEAVSACLLYPPFSEGSDRTAVIAPQLGYVPLAGTALMCAAAVLVETEGVTVTEPETAVVFDSAKGTSNVVATVEEGRCISARWTTTPPQIMTCRVPVTLQGDTTVPVTVASLGLPYAIARAEDLDVDIGDAEALGHAGSALSAAVGHQLPLREFGLDKDAEDYVGLIVGEVACDRQSGSVTVCIAWVSSTGWVASSPAATGSLCAAAYLCETGEHQYGQILNVASPFGNTLQCLTDSASAHVEAPVQIVAYAELVAE